MTSAMSPRGWQKPRDAPKSRLMTSSLLCATTRKSSGVLRNCYSFKKSFKMQNGSLTMQRGNPQRRAKAKSSSLLYMYSFIYCYDDLFGAFFFPCSVPSARHIIYSIDPNWCARHGYWDASAPEPDACRGQWAGSSTRSHSQGTSTRGSWGSQCNCAEQT